MLSQTIAEALNQQITAEFASGYLYLAMAAWFEEQNLQGFARWMRVQAQEETSHGLILFNYLCERGGHYVPGAVEGPAHEYTSPLAVFDKVRAHEENVTNAIHRLVDLALDKHDHATNNLLNWFVSEQVEEQSSTAAIVAKLKMVGSDNTGLFILDREMGARAFTLPLPLAGKL